MYTYMCNNLCNGDISSFNYIQINFLCALLAYRLMMVTWSNRNIYRQSTISTFKLYVNGLYSVSMYFQNTMEMPHLKVAYTISFNVKRLVISLRKPLWIHILGKEGNAVHFYNMVHSLCCIFHTSPIILSFLFV